MAGHHDTLMVFAGRRTRWVVPQDIYNGLVVGSAEDADRRLPARHEPAGSFAQPPQVDRRVIDLLAPGTNVATTGFDNRIDFATGTSLLHRTPPGPSPCCRSTPTTGSARRPGT